jgi:hypothetical protein
MSKNEVDGKMMIAVLGCFLIFVGLVSMLLQSVI